MRTVFLLLRFGTFIAFELLCNSRLWYFDYGRNQNV